MPDYAFWYLPTYITYTKILAHGLDHVRRFHGNCRTLEIINLKHQYPVNQHFPEFILAIVPLSQLSIKVVYLLHYNIEVLP